MLLKMLILIKHFAVVVYTDKDDVPVGAVVAVIVTLIVAAIAVMCGILFLNR